MNRDNTYRLSSVSKYAWSRVTVLVAISTNNNAEAFQHQQPVVVNNCEKLDRSGFGQELKA